MTYLEENRVKIKLWGQIPVLFAVFWAISKCGLVTRRHTWRPQSPTFQISDGLCLVGLGWGWDTSLEWTVKAITYLVLDWLNTSHTLSPQACWQPMRYVMESLFYRSLSNLEMSHRKNQVLAPWGLARFSLQALSHHYPSLISISLWVLVYFLTSNFTPYFTFLEVLTQIFLSPGSIRLLPYLM